MESGTWGSQSQVHFCMTVFGKVWQLQLSAAIIAWGKLPIFYGQFFKMDDWTDWKGLSIISKAQLLNHISKTHLLNNISKSHSRCFTTLIRCIARFETCFKEHDIDFYIAAVIAGVTFSAGCKTSIINSVAWIGQFKLIQFYSWSFAKYLTIALQSNSLDIISYLNATSRPYMHNQIFEKKSIWITIHTVVTPKNVTNHKTANNARLSALEPIQL